MTPTFVVSTIAGTSSRGFADGTGAAARSNYPFGIAFDPADGNLYVTDSENSALRTVSPADGSTTTILGGAPPTAQSGNADGFGNTALFGSPFGPFGIAYDSDDGNLYLIDRSNYTLRQVQP